MKKKFSLPNQKVDADVWEYALKHNGLKTSLSEEDTKQLKRLSISNIKISKGHEGEELLDCTILIDGQEVNKYCTLDWGGGDELLVSEGDIIKSRNILKAFLEDSDDESQFKNDYKGNPIENLTSKDYFLNVFYFVKSAFFYERQMTSIKRKCKKSLIVGNVNSQKMISFTGVTLAQMAEKFGTEMIREELARLLEKAGPRDVLYNSNKQLKELGLGDVIGTHPAIKAD